MTTTELSTKVMASGEVDTGEMVTLFTWSAREAKERAAAALKTPTLGRFSTKPRGSAKAEFKNTGRLFVRVVSNTGGEYSSGGYGVDHILEDNTSVWCTAVARNADVVFAHTGGGPMRVTSGRARGAGAGFTAPWGFGLVFALDSADDMKRTSPYNDWTLTEWSRYQSSKKAGSEVASHEPIAVISLPSTTEVTFDIVFPRDAPFVGVKFISPRNGGSNIDAAHCIFTGRW